MTDSVDLATERAFRLPVPALAVALAALVATGLFSAVNGAAGLPVGGVIASLIDWLPLVDIDSALSARQVMRTRSRCGFAMVGVLVRRACSPMRARPDQTARWSMCLYRSHALMRSPGSLLHRARPKTRWNTKVCRQAPRASKRVKAWRRG